MISKHNDGLKDARLLLVEVSDQGIGVPADKREFLFKPFSQTQRRAGGTGLGLYSLALRIQMLRGFYGFHDAPSGSGSVFFFAMPYAVGESAEMFIDDYVDDQVAEPIPVSSPRDAAGGSDTPSAFRRLDDRPFAFRPPRSSESHVHHVLTVEDVPDPPLSGRRGNDASSIYAVDSRGDASASSTVRILAPAPNLPPLMLIVDDAVPTLKVVTRSLAADGMVIETATDGFTALNMMKKQLYTCVLLDIQMPIMDGIEAARQLRDWERSQCTDGYQQLIIGGSANDDEETLRDARNAGMDDFIPKPFNLKALKLRINSLRAVL